jgi:hypothetical protein
MITLMRITPLQSKLHLATVSKSDFFSRKPER